MQNLSKKKALCVKDFVSKTEDKNVSMCNLIFVLPNEDVTSALKQLKSQMQGAADHLKCMA